MCPKYAQNKHVTQMFLGITHVLLEIYEIELRPASEKGNAAVLLYACLDWLTSSHFHCEI
jgi:hypothetical protein